MKKEKPEVEEKSKGDILRKQDHDRLEKQVHKSLEELKEITKGAKVYKCMACSAYTSADVPEDVDELVELHNYLKTTCCGKGDWAESSLGEWLGEQLEIEYVESKNGGYVGAIIMLSYGGSTIIVDTAKEKIVGTVGGGNIKIQKKLNDKIVERLDSALAELFPQKNNQ